MKRTIYLFLFGILTVIAHGQENLEVLNTTPFTARSLIDLAAGQITTGRSYSDPSAALTNLRLSIRGTDILIDYQLNPLEKDGEFYEVIPQVKLDQENFPLSFYDELRGDWGKGMAAGARQILWVTPLDRHLNLEGELEIILTVNTWGTPASLYDCSLGEPSFSSKQRLPYYAAAGVGVASLGMGQLFRKQRDDIYKVQYPNNKTESDAESFYQDANSKHQTYLILTYAGTAILLADVTLYLIRERKFKKDHELWEEWCDSSTSSLELRPSINLPTSSHAQASVGLKLNLTF